MRVNVYSTSLGPNEQVTLLVSPLAIQSILYGEIDSKEAGTISMSAGTDGVTFADTASLVLNPLVVGKQLLPLNSNPGNVYMRISANKHARVFMAGPDLSVRELIRANL